MRKRIPSILLLLFIIFGCALSIRGESKVDFQKIRILREKFQRKIIKISENLDGVVGVAIKNLGTGETFFHNENIVFPQASSIKIAILYELYKQSEENKINLEETVRLKRKDKVGGSGILQFLGNSTVSLSLKDLAVLMIVLSDNSATNILIDYIGMDKINHRLNTLGLKKTMLRRKMMDIDSAKQGKENVSTPYEMMTLLEKIYNEPFSWKILEVLSLPKNTPLRRGIPYQIRVANKPGGLRGVRCDSGIVLLKDSPYIICAMTTYLKNDQEGEEAITSISKTAYEYFFEITKYTKYGRRLFD
jgi:beta-lactamase class A